MQVGFAVFLTLEESQVAHNYVTEPVKINHVGNQKN